MQKLSYNNRSSYFILMGMLMYSMSVCVLSAFGLEQYHEYLKALSFFFIIISEIIFLPHTHSLYHQSYLNVLLFIYICLYIIAIVRGFDLRQRLSDISTRRWLIQIITDKYYILWGILPIMAKKVPKIFNFSRLITVIEVLCLFSIVSIGLNFNNIRLLTYSLYSQRDGSLYSVAFAYIFDVIAFFLIGLFYVKGRKYHLIIILTFFATFLARVLLARRGDVLMLLLLFLFLILSGRLNNSIKTFRSVQIFICIAIFAIFTMQSEIPSLLLSRGLEDTRSGVDEALLSSMTTSDFIFGKGINGSYYYPLGDNDLYDGQRYMSETGFFTLILKGGILMAAVYILLWLIPAFMGIFKSKNVFCKFTGLYLFWNVLYLFPFGNPEFSFNQLLVWVLAGLVSSPSIRRLSDEQIKTVYF